MDGTNSRLNYLWLSSIFEEKSYLKQYHNQHTILISTWIIYTKILQFFYYILHTVTEDKSYSKLYHNHTTNLTITEILEFFSISQFVAILLTGVKSAGYSTTLITDDTGTQAD